MTKLRMLQQVSGTRNGQPWPARGEEFDADPNEAATLTLGQTPIAEYVEDVDRTVAPAEERAVAPEAPQPVETAKRAAPATPASPATRTRSAAAKK